MTSICPELQSSTVLTTTLSAGGRKLLGDFDFAANFATLQQSAANVALQVGLVNQALQTNAQAANIAQSGTTLLQCRFYKITAF